MKTIIFSLIILLFSFNGNCQFISSIDVPIELRNAYDYDISQLALTRIFETNSSYKDSIIIPEIMKDTLWEGLTAIFNAKSILERDSVFDVYCIHQENCMGVSMQLFGVEVDTQYTWTKKWQNLEMHTDYDELDELLSRLNFKLYDFSGSATLGTSSFINSQAFIDSLKSFDGIVNAKTIGTNCCHNKIKYSKINDVKTFTFELGFCYGNFGCPNHYIWSFEIDNESNVELVEKKHIISAPSQPLPDGAFQNCNITNSVRNIDPTDERSIVVCPNPTDDLIFISSESNSRYRINLHDFNGRLLQESVFEKEMVMSLHDYPSGLYVLSFYNENNGSIKKMKIVKE